MRWTSDDQAGNRGQNVEMLPVMGELSEGLWQAIAEGQPVLFTRRGRPAGVLLDAESYAEVEHSFGPDAT